MENLNASEIKWHDVDSHINQEQDDGLEHSADDKTFEIGGGKKQENSGHEHSHGSIKHNHENSSNDKEVRFNKLDKNKDGKVERSEAKGKFSERFDRLDKNKDGFVSKEEFIGKSN